jgi:hypothetical protein
MPISKHPLHRQQPLCARQTLKAVFNAAVPLAAFSSHGENMGSAARTVFIPAPSDRFEVGDMRHGAS